MTDTQRKIIMVVGPQQSYLHWLKTTKGLGGVRIVHITKPRQIQGYSLEGGKDEIVDLTGGASGWREIVALAESVMR